MLLKNHYTALAIAFTGLKQSLIQTSGTSIAMDSSVFTPSNYTSVFKAMLQLSLSSTTAGVCFGTGTTPETIDDYCLENQITSGLSATFPSAVTRAVQTDGEEITVAFTLTASQAVTITEMGLITASNGNYSSWYYLGERTVLENPLVFAAGETKTINYTIRFNYPTV